MQNVIAYIDGFNLYYGLKTKGWRRFYWLNVQALAQHFLKPGQTLTQTKYFTTVMAEPPDKHQRQAVFLDALQTLPNFNIYYGHFLVDKVTCRHCGHTYDTYHEKMTDVNMAVELMTDAFQDVFDVALLISADSDLVGPVKSIRRLFPNKKVVVVFPPDRYSRALQQAASGQKFINGAELSKSLFSDQVVKANGVVLKRPAEWKSA